MQDLREIFIILIKVGLVGLNYLSILVGVGEVCNIRM